MQLIVNNCGQCPFYKESYDACNHPKADGYVEPGHNIIPENCPLKTSENEHVTWRQIKTLSSALTEEQLNQPVLIVLDDEETLIMIDNIEISKNDFYWDCGDCYGTIEEVKEFAKEENISLEEALENLSKVPAGTITLNSQTL